MLADGIPAVYLERGGSSLLSFPAADDPRVAGSALGALRTLVEDGRARELVVTRVDGTPVGSSAWRDRLHEAGFVPGYRGLVLRSAQPGRR